MWELKDTLLPHLGLTFDLTVECNTLTSLSLTYLSRGDGRNMLVCGTGQWKIKMPIKNLHDDLPYKRRKHKHREPPFEFLRLLHQTPNMRDATEM